MILPGLRAALQAAGPDSGASLTLGSWGVFALGGILAFAATGWILYLLSRQAPSFPKAIGGDEPREKSRGPGASPPRPSPLPHSGNENPPLEDPAGIAYRAAEGGLADAVLLVRDGRVVRCGAGTRALLSAAGESLIGLRLTDLAAAEDALPLAESLREIERNANLPASVSFRLRVPGVSAGRDVTARIFRPAGSPPGSFVVALSDAGEKAAAAREASEILSRVEEAIAALSEGILLTSGRGESEIILLMNGEAREILAFRTEPAAGRPLRILRESLASIFDSGSVQAILNPSPAEANAIFETIEDPRRLIERSVRPLEDGSPGRLFTFRDRTRDMAREDELQRAASEAADAREGIETLYQDLSMANEGLERRMSDLGRLNRELKALDEMKSNLLANVSHELQTPLVSVKGYTEMILKGRLGPVTEEQDRGLKVALRNIDRLIALIDNLLTFARAEKEASRLRITAFPLRALVEEAIELLLEKAVSRRVRVSASFPGGDLSIRGDRDKILQVFINLIGNAVKYNVEGGSVVIEAAKGRRALAKVEIRDTGAGIPRDDLEKIFDRFYRGGAGSRSDTEGTGLGLAITKDILRLHGCMIRADSEPGKGSTFSFTLPLDRGRAERASRSIGSSKDEA